MLTVLGGAHCVLGACQAPRAPQPLPFHGRLRLGHCGSLLTGQLLAINKMVFKLLLALGLQQESNTGNAVCPEGRDGRYFLENVVILANMCTLWTVTPAAEKDHVTSKWRG